MIITKSNETYDFDKYEIYSLNLRCRLFENFDFQRFHSEFENVSPLLFVKNSSDCQIDVLETINMCSERHFRISKQSITIENENKFNQKKQTFICISSFCDL